jgi:hypothetical protein
MKKQWTKEQVWEWYNSHPWIRGCNFIGSDCANRIDQWQSYGREERMKVADRELELAASIGFNTIRIIADFDVWLQERESYMSVLEEYLTLASKHGLSVCYVLATEVQNQYAARIRVAAERREQLSRPRMIRARLRTAVRMRKGIYSFNVAFGKRRIKRGEARGRRVDAADDGNNPDFVSDSDRAVCAPEAFECNRLQLRNICFFDRKGIIGVFGRFV